jgi:hypothetical protein
VVETFQALVVAVLAILPGAVFTWAYEQQAGRWGAKASDRLLRFLGASSVFLIFALPLLYQGYRELIITHKLEKGTPLPAPAWLLPVAYVSVPYVAGRLLGLAAQSREPWTKLFTGPAPAPRAWDHLFATPKLTGWIRLKLKDGTWVFGAWGKEVTAGPVALRSYAAGYPEPQDLYLVDTAQVDSQGIAEPDPNDPSRPLLTGVGVLIRWEEVLYAEYREG